MIKENDKVTYNSTGRPWLLNREGKVVRISATGNSVLVDFEDNEIYNKTSEWVGVGALEVVKSENTVSAARAAVQSKIRELEKEISTLRSKISKLNYANKALKDMEDDV